MSTPGSTHASRLRGSTDRIRFIFVSAITTASSSGVAPPASPVPAPRATNGTPWRDRGAHDGLHLLGRLREADDAGVALDVRGVAPVQAELGRPGAHAIRRERPAEVVDERAHADRAEQAAVGSPARIARRPGSPPPARQPGSPRPLHRRAPGGARSPARARPAGRRRSASRSSTSSSSSASVGDAAVELARAARAPCARIARRPSRTASPTSLAAPAHLPAGAPRDLHRRELGRRPRCTLRFAAPTPTAPAATPPTNHVTRFIMPTASRSSSLRRRSRRTARDVPVASAAVLITGVLSAARATRPLPDIALLIASAEPSTRSNRSRSSRASRDRPRPRCRSTRAARRAAARSRRAASPPRARSARNVSSTRSSTTISAAKPRQHSTAPMTSSELAASSLSLHPLGSSVLVLRAAAGRRPPPRTRARSARTTAGRPASREGTAARPSRGGRHEGTRSRCRDRAMPRPV